MNTTKKLMTLMLMALAIALQASAGYEALTYNGINYEFYFSGTGNNAVGDSVKVGNNSGFSGVANIASSVTCEYTYVTGQDAQGNPIYTTRNLTAPVIAISKKAFQNCRDLTSVIIPNSVTEIGEYAFAHCLYLTNLSIGNSVDSIGQYAFLECASLPSVTIPNSVTSIPKGCFSQCRSMTSVSFPNTVTDIGTRAFYDCRKLTSVNIPNSVTTIGDSTFYGCTGLANVMIGNSTTSIPRSCFNGCTSLTSVNIPNSVTAIGDKAFSNCSSLTSIIIPNSVTTLGSYVFNECSNLASATIGNSVTAIGDNAFYDCRKLMGIVIPNSVTSIGNKAFYRCFDLANVTIGNSVTSIGESAFYFCQSLKSVTIPDAVITIAYGAFYECENIEHVTLGNSVTTLGNSAFLNCISLKGLVIPNSVTTIGNDAFFNCNKMTSVTIGNSVTRIGNSAFLGCASLTSVEIPNSVTEMGASVFYSCSNLRSVNISNSLTAIPSNCFMDCIRLDNIIIPNSVTTIWTSAFAGCRNLSSITFPNSIREINGNAFYDCNSLTDVTCLATTPPTAWEATFGNYDIATLHVPATSIEQYKTTEPWKRFYSIQPIDTQPGDEDDYEYVPFVREGVKWTYSIDDYRFFEDYETNPARGDNKVYRTLEIKGDTVINGKTYKAMHMCTDDVYSEPKDVVPIYLREENKMVYGIVPDGKHYDDATLGHMAIYSGEEFLLYDFQDPVTYWENLINDHWLNIPLQMDTIEVGGHYVKRLFDERQEGDYFQIIEGIGAMGMNSYPLCFLMPVATGIHMSEYYSLVKVEEDGAVIYPHPGYAEDRYMPLIREGVKWIYEKVTIQGGDTICQYYTYEFNGNHPEKTDYDCVCKALYRYDGQQHDLDVENDSIVAGMMENEAIIKSYFNEPMKQVDSQDRNMINLGSGNSYTLYELATNHGWLVCHYYYVMNQKESFFNDANFVKADPIMIDGYLCSRLAYLDELGDTLAYVVEGIGFDSYDMGDLLTPFTRKPDPNADYQEWCGLSHVIKDGKIIYKGMCYHPIEIPGDVNGDGEVTVADANSVIDVVIMGGNASHPRIPIDNDGNYIGDVNGDGEVTIADVNAIIDMILNNH